MSKPTPNKPLSTSKTQPQITPTAEFEEADYFGDTKAEVKPVAAQLAVAPGMMVTYHQNNPNEEGILSWPALIVKVNNTGSVSLQVFTETHIQPFSKIPLAKEPTPGYFTL